MFEFKIEKEKDSNYNVIIEYGGQLYLHCNFITLVMIDKLNWLYFSP